MKCLLAFIPPEHLDNLVEELAQHHVHGLTISDARGFGQEHDRGHPDHREYPGVDLIDKTRVEIVCRDDEVDEIMACFYSAGHSGRRGDGKVFVIDVIDALRLKTGERGDSALGPGSQRTAERDGGGDGR